MQVFAAELADGGCRMIAFDHELFDGADRNLKASQRRWGDYPPYVPPYVNGIEPQ